MPKFVFQLDGVLRQRRHQEQQRQRELGQIQQQLGELQSQLQLLNEQVNVATGDVRRNQLVGRLDLLYLAGHRRHMMSLQRQALTLVQQMALLQRQVEQAQRNLAEAAKQRKVIEKLREKHRQRWMAALSRRELSEQDEIGMQLSYYAGRALDGTPDSSVEAMP